MDGSIRSAGIRKLAAIIAAFVGFVLYVGVVHGAPHLLASVPQDVPALDLVRPTALYFTCFGIYVLVAVIFVMYWQWMGRDHSMLAIGLLAVVMAVHTAAISGSLPYLFSGLLGANAGAMLEMLSYILLNGVIAFMLWAYFPQSFRPPARDWVGTLNSAVAGTAAALSIVFATAATFVEDAEPLLGLSRWMTFVLMIVVAALAIQSMQSRRRFGKVTAAGLLLLIVGSIHDVLFANAGRTYLITFAVLGFILLQSYVYLRRNAESTQSARLSSRRLRRKVEERTREIQAASVAAQAANLAKTEFVTAVTHELRTPLSSLLGYVDLIRDEVAPDLKPEQREFFDSLELSAERLLNLVNNLLDLAKIESGRIDVHLEPVDVAAVASEVRSELYPIAHEKGLYLKVQLDAEEVHIVTDEQWLSVVLTNLVSNAVKYTEEGGVTIAVTSTCDEDRSSVCIHVSDTGPGISPEFMPRLFQRFTREERARDHVPTGTGLGLTIVQELLDHLDGDISVDSRPGAGTTFSITLPKAGPKMEG